MLRGHLITAAASIAALAAISATPKRTIAANAIDDDIAKTKMTKAMINFFTFKEDGDDKKQGSTFLCQVVPANQPPNGIIIYGQNKGEATAPAFPDNSTSVLDHGFPGGIQIVIDPASPLKFADWQKAAVTFTFSGVDDDTWKTDFHIKLTFANGQIVRRRKNHMLFNTTGQAHQRITLANLETDDWNDSGRW